ncbi:Six-hairpin glycosidase-like protein [Ephemerocybe angulata]|uniref:Six-hairpin glycosidase-like protein n=1 Tax=Ephemerocybe angulata TaxID=980116 RepID=A0A8H6M6G6_9AGAR|nr:Six-hairpin glycosidase-like protein [Tulosesus angulatus]
MGSFTRLTGIALLALLAGPVDAQELAEEQVNLVSSRLAESARRSWEIGTRAQAILEHNATRYSVFANNDLPPPSNIPGDQQGPLEPLWNIARGVLSGGAGGNTAQPLVSDSAVSDPASIGVAVLLANYTNLDKKDDQYEHAARNQYDYLMSNAVPKNGQGAISHKTEQIQLWSDAVYMVPPFLAYYGVITNDRTPLDQAYEQIKQYRAQLYDSNAGAWKHIVGGNSGTDDSFWATGNAWAAAGMLRVYATIDKSKFSGKMKSQKKDIKNWVQEIHKGVYERYFDGENLLRNHLNDPNTFYDAASSALLASTVYRASTVMGQHKYVPYAERTRMTLFTPNTGPWTNTNWTRFGDYQYFTTDGWLRPVVDPMNTGNQGQNSPEAQAFVVLLHSAWRDWRWAGEKGKNAAGRIAASYSTVLVSALSIAVGSLLL